MMINEKKMILRQCNLRSANEFAEFRNMYRAYIHELSAFSPRLNDISVTYETFQIWNARHTEKYFIEHEEKVVGFLLLGVNENKHPDSDWYIEEFYIKKEFQSRGLGKLAATELFRNKPGRYCLFILRENTKAFLFWKKVFEGCGYINVSKQHVDTCTPSDCEFLMYEPTLMKNGRNTI